MSSDQASVLLGPRDTAGCLDTSVQLCGRYLSVILPIWLIAAVPTGLVVYLLITFYSLDLRTGLLVVYFATIPLGYLLIQGVAGLVFGDQWDLRGTLQSVNARSLTPFLQAVASRIVLGIGPFLVLFIDAWQAVTTGLLLCLFPGLWLLIRGSFIFEKSALSRLGEHLYSRNTRELIKEHFSTLLNRAFWIFGYCMLVLIVLLVSAETLMTLCFGTSLIRPIMSEFSLASEPIGLVWEFVTHDAATITWLSVTSLLVYTMGRLAWFVSYIDLRVRYDCWDMELKMFEQARRLREGR